MRALSALVVPTDKAVVHCRFATVSQTIVVAVLPLNIVDLCLSASFSILV